MVLNVEEWKLTREVVKNEIYEKDRTDIDILKKKLENTRTLEDRANIFWQLSEKYKLLFWGYAEEHIIFADTPKKEYYRNLEREYLWNCIYYREKCLQIIKQNDAIEANDGIFMDVGLKYRYFIRYDYDYEEIEEERFRFDTFGNTANEKMNIIINDLDYAKRGMYYLLKIYEKEKNNEELFIWYEVMGDLNLITQLLLLEGGRNDLIDNAKQALLSYKKSRENLKVFAKPTIHYAGIYGLSYQSNFFDLLLKSFGFEGYVLSGIDKMKFIEQKLLKKESGLKSVEYPQFLNNIPLLERRIARLINKYRILESKEGDFEDWKTFVSFAHNELLNYNYEQRDLNNTVATWKRETDMQNWIQRIMDRYLREKRMEPSFYSIREGISGGGSCDHTYKKIPICDKWKRDTNTKGYPVKISDFIDKVYKDHYEQVKSYANDVKLAIMIVVDSREVTRKKNPDMVKDCYAFKTNEQDGVIVAIFVIQVSDTPPSKRK